jgi:hypothetical protein
LKALEEADKTIAPWELGSYILENFATAEEVRANVPNIVVPDVILEAWKFVPPVHYVVHDATGKSIVIEYTEGKLNIYDNHPMAHLASVRPLIDAALAARAHQLVGETPLLLNIEACTGRLGDNIYTR